MNKKQALTLWAVLFIGWLIIGFILYKNYGGVTALAWIISALIFPTYTKVSDGPAQRIEITDPNAKKPAKSR